MIPAKDREKFVAHLARELPCLSVTRVVDLARLLLRASAVLQQINDDAYNGDLTEMQKRSGKRILARVMLACQEVGLVARGGSGDPRGPSLLLKLPSGRGDYREDPSLFCVP